jgi:hypothetical protein
MMMMHIADLVAMRMAADMDVDLRIGGSGAQKGEGKDRSNKRFHGVSLFCYVSGKEAAGA